MIGFGFVKDWKALMGLRLILGILEVRDATLQSLATGCLQPIYHRAAFSPVSSTSSVLGINAVGILQHFFYIL